MTLTRTRNSLDNDTSHGRSSACQRRLVTTRAPWGLTLTVMALSVKRISPEAARHTGTAIEARFSLLPSRGIEPGAISGRSFSRARSGLDDSGLALGGFLVVPFLFIHGLVRLRHKFTERNGTLGIKPRHANANRQLVASFAGMGLLERLLEAAEENFLGRRGGF